MLYIHCMAYRHYRPNIGLYTAGTYIRNIIRIIQYNILYVTPLQAKRCSLFYVIGLIVIIACAI